MNDEGLLERRMRCDLAERSALESLQGGVLTTIGTIELINVNCPVAHELMVMRSKEAKIPNDHVVFEFELERERRILVEVEEGLLGDIHEWDNTIEDTYDQSGRLRIREKNGKLRMTVKIPLFHEIDPNRKHCLRIELKPCTVEPEKQIAEARELLRREIGTQEFKKYGKKIALKNGVNVWINANDEGEFWIEYDDELGKNVEDLLPEGITYLRDEISKVEIHQNPRRDMYKKAFFENLSMTSRTASGNLDASVSTEKQSHQTENVNVSEIVRANEHRLFDFLWESRSEHFDNPVSLLGFVDNLAGVVNNNLVKSPKLWRTWDVDYGRKIKADDLSSGMMRFANDFIAKYADLDSEADYVEFACWVELEVDRHLHPYVDGVGRIAKALSFWVLMSKGLALPDYGSRGTYYKAMNNGDETFQEYYRQAYERGRDKW